MPVEQRRRTMPDPESGLLKMSYEQFIAHYNKVEEANNPEEDRVPPSVESDKSMKRGKKRKVVGVRHYRHNSGSFKIR